ncbi:MAG: fumarylacetoacetate hydrolase, partial [Candidatus Electrothrix sp. AR5]|nr:fumarylacetoacetate hydrolase [Candidatus Electrothrix sp. AR5]
TISATPEFVQALADLETIFTDETGAVLQKAPGSNLLGHPLRAVLWLIKELEARGETLQAGQLISLGGFGKLFPLKEPGKTYILTYTGLPGGPLSTSVRISE